MYEYFVIKIMNIIFLRLDVLQFPISFISLLGTKSKILWCQDAFCVEQGGAALGTCTECCTREFPWPLEKRGIKRDTESDLCHQAWKDNAFLQ